MGWYATSAKAATHGNDSLTSDTPFIYDNDDTKVYAGWKKHTYTLKFHANNGKFVDGGNTLETEVDYKDAYSDASKTGYSGSWDNNYNVSRTYYDFDGWYTAAEAGDGIKIEGSTTYNPNITDLYAHWKLHEYTCTLDPNGAPLPSGWASSFTITHGQTIEQAYGHDFGDFRDAGRQATWSIGNEQINPGSKVWNYIQDTIMEATWTIAQVVVSLDPLGYRAIIIGET